VLDQEAARTRFLGASAIPLTAVARFPLPLEEMLGGTPLPDGGLLVTPAPLFEESRKAALARAVRDTLLARGSGPASRALPDDLRASAAEAGTWLGSCRAGGPAPFPLDAFVHLAVSAFPLVSAADLEPVWTGVDGPACRAAMEPSAAAWVELLRAVARRDAPGMAEAGAIVLASARPGGAPLRYAVASTMLGLVASGNRDGARTVWERHGPALAGTPDLALDVLAAAAVSAPSPRAP
jgi:hypothetical protein